MNESINDKAVYRTAPATPGLLITRLPHYRQEGLGSGVEDERVEGWRKEDEGSSREDGE